MTAGTAIASRTRSSAASRCCTAGSSAETPCAPRSRTARAVCDQTPLAWKIRTIAAARATVDSPLEDLPADLSTPLRGDGRGSLLGERRSGPAIVPERSSPIESGSRRRSLGHSASLPRRSASRPNGERRTDTTSRTSRPAISSSTSGSGRATASRASRWAARCSERGPAPALDDRYAPSAAKADGSALTSTSASAARRTESA